MGEKPLGEYVKNVLLLESAEFGSKIISEQVLLKHIDSLWKLLRDFCVTDPFAGVSPKYREKLDAASHEAMLKSAEQLDKKVLLPLLKEFITSRLADEHYGLHSSPLRFAFALLHRLPLTHRLFFSALRRLQAKTSPSKKSLDSWKPATLSCPTWRGSKSTSPKRSKCVTSWTCTRSWKPSTNCKRPQPTAACCRCCQQPLLPSL